MGDQLRAGGSAQAEGPYPMLQAKYPANAFHSSRITADASFFAASRNA